MKIGIISNIMENHVIKHSWNNYNCFRIRFYEVMRLNKIWAGMIIISIVLYILGGRIEDLITELMLSTQSVLETVLDMLGMMCMWSGFMKIAEEAGVVKAISKKVTPIVKFLFPELPKNNEATGHIAMNMTANILGLGNVATPLGLKAMEKLEEYNNEKNRLSNSMMMFIILNTASIQLIPTSVITLRATYNSNNPADVVLPIIIASFGSVLAGIIMVKFSCRRKK